MSYLSETKLAAKSHYVTSDQDLHVHVLTYNPCLYLLLLSKIQIEKTETCARETQSPADTLFAAQTGASCTHVSG